MQGAGPPGCRTAHRRQHVNIIAGETVGLLAAARRWHAGVGEASIARLKASCQRPKASFSAVETSRRQDVETWEDIPGKEKERVLFALGY